ncbi:23S rRNA (adenine(2030)-N(6))-methyltransferase RlmJ [Acinetobacter baumannii]|nr:23S rRNA (adenine(2030)-N(6))-methyltransferase RlmJ [Acinetobacter baumannii]MDO7404983.1 23S rRNA (adenine(2030)-N(6))-methyltransferase RlmJ [Acinetobacter baumannii]MDV7574232.1 23S rRNA (adenine(2030)-N(6))-methyltransferase RlmJ [Acinetobacter baumannii]HEM7758510.1 23S rRNA (adenine(2030)-N(6))-methyltransferase RlmJ [Acinetobacter baumannii]
MNYRHHFHAGNFADVMKHVLLLQLLNRLNAKDKLYRYIDTHGGAGKYDLSQAPAQKSGEFLTGIHRLVQLSDMEKRQAPEAIQQYLKLVEELRAQEGKGSYPGSPWFALQGMREIDKATIFEMQRDVFQQLRHNIHDKRAGLHERDAYEGLLAVIPPKEKRGLVMIDPPYELERKDFPQLVELLQSAYKKWPTGVFAVWYPIKDRAMIERFEKKMFKTGIRRQLICEICVWPDDTPVGLNGCGLLVINPPWQFSEQADQALQWLFPHLRMQETGGHAAVRWLVGE